MEDSCSKCTEGFDLPSEQLGCDVSLSPCVNWLSHTDAIRLKVQEQITLESPGQVPVFLFTLSTVWFKASKCTLIYRQTFIASYFMSPLRPFKSPSIQKCIQPYFNMKVLWTLPKALFNLDNFTEQFRARLHQLLSTQSSVSSSLWQPGRTLQWARGAGGNTNPHPGSDCCSLHQPVELSQHHFRHLQNSCVQL